ncbi:hypothetical protein CBM2606_A30420 [Cupriavidus taiwanensis]|nr:hypothetical protein CBM2606_A30420 [Cupriavidus taiwanensis]
MLSPAGRLKPPPPPTPRRCTPSPLTGRGSKPALFRSLSLPDPSGLHLAARSDYRTPLRASRPVPRTVRRHHIIFSFAFKSLHRLRATFALARRVQYRPPLTAPDRYAGTPPASRPMPKKQRRTHP